MRNIPNSNSLCLNLVRGVACSLMKCFSLFSMRTALIHPPYSLLSTHFSHISHFRRNSSHFRSQRGLKMFPESSERGNECGENPSASSAMESSIKPSPKWLIPKWAMWALGSLSLFLPFRKTNRNKAIKIEGEVEEVIEKVETVAKVVEKVAIVVEEVSSYIADKLPEGGNLKEAAILVENVSKEVVNDAQVAKDLIHKLGELKDEVEEVIEPVVKNQELLRAKHDNKKT
ncbi:uncharacterized protein LOC18423289 [Amborella trichopoda]|uniref:uncharacterized protein LOC18423289 n=1 Tax=Amborella trichopoda TaxID=13333 RepID=UPI0009BD4605|nr:uncharacterized protein LOC18423289 [Amborella trichopoda]|eukprot:XP_020528268.1 uncharacterized protein LOC18423289 [Amborella trichopoda]